MASGLLGSQCGVSEKDKTFCPYMPTANVKQVSPTVQDPSLIAIFDALEINAAARVPEFEM